MPTENDSSSKTISERLAVIEAINQRNEPVFREIAASLRELTDASIRSEARDEELKSLRKGHEELKLEVAAIQKELPTLVMIRTWVIRGVIAVLGLVGIAVWKGVGLPR